MSEDSWLSSLQFDASGLVPVVAQDARSGAVLMVAWANREALARTRETGEAHYYSRSRSELWHKGLTSGNVQRIREIRIDCDRDTVLYRVDAAGPACHTGEPTCFSARLDEDGRMAHATDGGATLLGRLALTIADRADRRPAGSYTAELLAQGIGKTAQKVGEEAVEVVVAATTEDDDRLASEAADLLFHLLVLLQARGVPLDAVWKELEHRSR